MNSWTRCIMWVQAAVQQLRTPGVQSFLHLAPAALLLWLTEDVAPLSTEGLQAALVPTVLTGLQVGPLCSVPSMACFRTMASISWLAAEFQTLSWCPYARTQSTVLLQVLSACMAATSCSVFLLLAVLTYVPQLASFERGFLLEKQPLSALRTLCLAVGEEVLQCQTFWGGHLPPMPQALLQFWRVTCVIDCPTCTPG